MEFKGTSLHPTGYINNLLGETKHCGDVVHVHLYKHNVVVYILLEYNINEYKCLTAYSNQHSIDHKGPEYNVHVHA